MKHLWLWAISAALLGAQASAQDFDGVEIRSEEIAPGVAVLFGAGGNIAVSHGEDATLMVDDQFAPLSDRIESAVADLGASPVKYVVNTHWHYDHTGGNEHFGRTGATIFAHDNVRVRMIEGGTVAGRAIAPAERHALPVVTYPHGLAFHLNGDTIDIVYMGGGHTDGDSVVIWQEANVIHMGDLHLNIRSFPFADHESGGDVRDMIDTLDAVIAMIDDETRVIPGHGPMSNRGELIAYRAMIAESVARVEALRAQGHDLAEAVAAAPLADMDRDGGFVSGDAFVEAIWHSQR
ncbi:MBL fold metallo-hydrolase [Qipengyuania nanhaisediminis]|uniref:MBL fold metallo-hydrolase n=1 Tax=Qipengyuania nanhaisediminis TaxID=604088 RepID=UPI0038B323B6